MRRREEVEDSITVNNSTLLQFQASPSLQVGASIPEIPLPPLFRLDDLKNSHEEVHGDRRRSLEKRGNIHPLPSLDLLLYFAPLHLLPRSFRDISFLGINIHRLVNTRTVNSQTDT